MNKLHVLFLSATLLISSAPMIASEEVKNDDSVEQKVESPEVDDSVKVVSDEIKTGLAMGAVAALNKCVKGIWNAPSNVLGFRAAEGSYRAELGTKTNLFVWTIVAGSVAFAYKVSRDKVKAEQQKQIENAKIDNILARIKAEEAVNESEGVAEATI